MGHVDTSNIRLSVVKDYQSLCNRNYNLISNSEPRREPPYAVCVPIANYHGPVMCTGPHDSTIPSNQQCEAGFVKRREGTADKCVPQGSGISGCWHPYINER